MGEVADVKYKWFLARRRMERLIGFLRLGATAESVAVVKEMELVERSIKDINKTLDMEEG